MQRIWCISGLGADHSVFRKLRIPGFELVPLIWIPYDQHESLPDYAHKLAEKIEDPVPIIIGLSFGGMLATEIARHRQIKKAILISSAASSAELHMPANGILKWIFLSRVLPAGLFTIPNPVFFKYLGAETVEDRQMLRTVIKNSDGRFIKWALEAIASWPDAPRPANLIHIHGTADKIIPAKLVHADYWIPGGSHIMVYNRADEVSKIISQCLAT